MKRNQDFSTLLDVVIPRKEHQSHIEDGSAIVMQERGEFTNIYYEGNQYGATNMETINGRLQIAASRLLTSAPTVAKMSLTTEMANTLFQKIGQYQYSSNTLNVDSTCLVDIDRWVRGYKNLNIPFTPEPSKETNMISNDDFETMFEPSDTMTFDEATAYMLKHKLNDKHLWTVIDRDNDDNLHAIAGWHMVGRVNYVITKRPWGYDGQQAMWLDYSDVQGKS